VTRDHALLAVELATRLGTTPALRAAFAPVVWRARVSLKSDVTRVPQVSVLGSDVPRGGNEESPAFAAPGSRDVLSEVLS
jgi:hypothetical protein